MTTKGYTEHEEQIARFAKAMGHPARMAVVGLSLPEATMLKKAMTWRLIAIFFGTVTLFIILSGYLFNLIL